MVKTRLKLLTAKIYFITFSIEKSSFSKIQMVKHVLLFTALKKFKNNIS